MNFRAISIYLGYLLVLEGVCMLPGLAISAWNAEAAMVRAFVVTIAILVLIGLPLMLRKRSKRDIVYAREGFFTVAAGWIVISVFGALPFFFSGHVPNFADCLFETVSGFTTTGASILTDVEALPMGLLFWRSFTHWLGGMGVLVLMLAIIPLSKGAGDTLHIMRAESPGPVVGKLVPTMRRTVRILYLIYTVLTVLTIVLLVLGGMPLFDSVAHAFGAAGTGGFSVKNASIGSYNSTYIEIVISVAVLVFGTNFAVFYMILAKQARQALKSGELRLYAALVVGFTILIALNIRPMYGHFSEALLDSFFQVSTLITTTGYNTTNFDLWPQFARYSLIVLIWIGACAGSTGGGVKVSRVLILWTALKNQLLFMLRPRAIRPVRMDGKVLDNSIVQGVYGYLVAYLFILLISVLITSLDDVSMETYVTAVITCLSNSGPGLDMVGPFGNFHFFSDRSTLVLCMDMLLGRLEIFPLLLLFAPSAWKRQA